MIDVEINEFSKCATKYIETYINEFIDSIKELTNVSIVDGIDKNSDIIQFPTEEKNIIYNITEKILNNISTESSKSISQYINKMIKKCDKHNDLTSTRMMKRLIKHINKHEPDYNIGRNYKTNEIDVMFKSPFFNYNKTIPIS